MVPERITQLLTAYVDGELGPRQRKAVSRMLRKSAEARRLYQQIKGDSLILRRLPRKRPTIDLTDTVLGNIAAANLKIPIRPEAIPLPPGPPPLPAKAIPAWVVFAVAAAVLLIVGIGSYFYFAAGGAEIGRDLIAESRPSQPLNPCASSPCPACLGEELPETSPKDVFAYPNLKAPSFGTARAHVPLVLSLRNAQDHSFTSEVQEELQKDRAFRFDLFAADNGRAFEQLKTNLAEQGVQLKLDSSVPSPTTGKLNLAFYVEGLTPTELTRLLRRLGRGDRNDPAPFTRVAITRLPAWRGPLAGIDLHQPLEEMTLDQVLQAPPRPESVKLASDPTGVVVPYNPAHVAPSKAVKSVLDRNPSLRPGTIQVLVVLWAN